MLVIKASNEIEKKLVSLSNERVSIYKGYGYNTTANKFRCYYVIVDGTDVCCEVFVLKNGTIRICTNDVSNEEINSAIEIPTEAISPYYKQSANEDRWIYVELWNDTGFKYAKQLKDSSILLAQVDLLIQRHFSIPYKRVLIDKYRCTVKGRREQII